MDCFDSSVPIEYEKYQGNSQKVQSEWSKVYNEWNKIENVIISKKIINLELYFYILEYEKLINQIRFENFFGNEEKTIEIETSRNIIKYLLNINSFSQNNGINISSQTDINFNESNLRKMLCIVKEKKFWF